MRQYARLAFNCNELPKDVEHTVAFFRRLLIIPFSVFIPKEERNPALAKQIVAAEASGVLNWILEGLRRLLSQGGFTPNPLADAELDEYKLESNSVALFVAEYGYSPAKGTDDSVKLSDMHSDYSYFCSTNIHRPVGPRKMNKRLKALEFESEHRKDGTYVLASQADDKRRKRMY